MAHRGEHTLVQRGEHAIERRPERPVERRAAHAVEQRAEYAVEQLGEHRLDDRKKRAEGLSPSASVPGDANVSQAPRRALFSRGGMGCLHMEPLYGILDMLVLRTLVSGRKNPSGPNS